jgi:hypothetical protein
VILSSCVLWLLFVSAWLLVVFTDGRVFPGLHGPGSLGYFLRAAAVCFLGAAITAITAAVRTLVAFRSVPPRLRILGLAPIACMALLILGSFLVSMIRG